jgi:hypothetical protein
MSKNNEHGTFAKLILKHMSTKSFKKIKIDLKGRCLNSQLFL